MMNLRLTYATWFNIEFGLEKARSSRTEMHSECLSARKQPTGCRVLLIFKLSGLHSFDWTGSVRLHSGSSRTGIYSFNERNYDLFDDKLQKYLDDLRKPGPNGKPYSGRYIGCLVGEIHRMLLVGGIYGNPDNKKAKNGNLRLLYECAPMSYLIEQAGEKRSMDAKEY